MLKKKYVKVLLFITVCNVLFPQKACAYLDPGTGSMFFQMIIAVTAAAGYAIKLYWNKLHILLCKKDDHEK